jgi:hypothetical protein
MAGNSKLVNSKTFQNNEQNNGPSIGSNVGVAAAGGALAGNSGVPSNTCSTSDQSIYCQMVRTLGMTQMIITFVIIFFAIMFIIYYVYSNRKTLFGSK